jgi:hypothetical protein
VVFYLSEKHNSSRFFLENEKKPLQPCYSSVALHADHDKKTKNKNSQDRTLTHGLQIADPASDDDQGFDDRRSRLRSADRQTHASRMRPCTYRGTDT